MLTHSFPPSARPLSCQVRHPAEPDPRMDETRMGFLVEGQGQP